MQRSSKSSKVPEALDALKAAKMIAKSSPKKINKSVSKSKKITNSSESSKKSIKPEFELNVHAFSAVMLADSVSSFFSKHVEVIPDFPEVGPYLDGLLKELHSMVRIHFTAGRGVDYDDDEDPLRGPKHYVRKFAALAAVHTKEVCASAAALDIEAKDYDEPPMDLWSTLLGEFRTAIDEALKHFMDFLDVPPLFVKLARKFQIGHRTSYQRELVDEYEEGDFPECSPEGEFLCPKQEQEFLSVFPKN